MSKITQKLRSKRGASLVLAMVFLLMCLFVGGSVLAAATANGGRVAGLTNNQQTYLSQRSAALLMSDMLTGGGKSLQLTIKSVTTVTTDPETGAKTESTVVTYSLPIPENGQSYSSLQRLLVENALMRYRAARPTPTESFTGFAFTNLSGLYVKETSTLYSSNTGSFSIKVTNPDNSVVEELAVTFYSPLPEESTAPKSENFDLNIHFGADSQLYLYVKANYDEGKAIEVTQGNITTTTTTTVIRWADPVIEKGGFTP